MQKDLLIAVLTGLGAMLGWGFADFFAKKTIDKIGDITTLFWNQFIGIFPILALYLFSPSVPKLSNFELIALAILGIWSGLSYLPVYIAFGKGKISLLSPIFASYAVVVALLSAFFLKEVIPVNRQIAFLIVFSGILLINGDPRGVLSFFRRRKVGEVEKVEGLLEIFLAVSLYSVWLIVLDHFINGRYWVPYLLVIRVFSAISLFSYAKLKKQTLQVKYGSLWKFLILIGLFDVAAFSSVSFGFSKTSFVSVVAMLSGAFSLPTIILARTFLKERVTKTQTVGSLIIILGIIILSIN